MRNCKACGKEFIGYVRRVYCKNEECRLERKRLESQRFLRKQPGYGVKKNKSSSDFKKIIAEDYKNNLTISEISNKHKISTNTVAKIAKEFGLCRTLEQSEVADYFKALKTKIVETKSNKTETSYLVKCSECGTEKWAISHQLTRIMKKSHKYLCSKCDCSIAKKARAPQQRKRVDNKTGYIGVSTFRKGNGSAEFDIAGYKAVINHKGIKVLKNKYKDEYLKTSTLLQAAFDRDMFIIEKELPHRRNFTDKQLIELVQTLGISQFSEMEAKIKSGAMTKLH